MIVRCRTVSYIDKNQLSAADLRRLMILRYRCCTIRSSAGISEISTVSSLYGGRRLQDCVNSTSEFNLTLVKTLKPVFYFSHCGVF
jgi:hypothetical protein